MFRDESSATRQLHWLDFNGRRVPYATLPSSGDYSVNAFVGHPWVATDTTGRRVAVFFPDAQPRRLAPGQWEGLGAGKR